MQKLLTQTGDRLLPGPRSASGQDHGKEFFFTYQGEAEPVLKRLAKSEVPALNLMSVESMRIGEKDTLR